MIAAGLSDLDVASHAPTGVASPGRVDLSFCRAGSRTVLQRAFAASPARLLTPRNHGNAAWVFLASLGGGLLDRDCIDVRVRVAAAASALLGTQASTKIYRSPRGCSQRLIADVGGGAALTLIPDPVVCFEKARYAQEITVALGPGASLVLLDGYTCGRSARGERWQFDAYASRTVVTRGGARLLVDATCLDPASGPIAARMGEFDVVLSLFVVGPLFQPVREAVLASPDCTAGSDATRVVAASPVGEDGAIVRVAAHRFERATQVLRPSFTTLARALGDDPFARKW